MILDLSYKHDQNHLIIKNITLYLPQVKDSLQVFHDLLALLVTLVCTNVELI